MSRLDPEAREFTPPGAFVAPSTALYGQLQSLPTFHPPVYPATFPPTYIMGPPPSYMMEFHPSPAPLRVQYPTIPGRSPLYSKILRLHGPKVKRITKIMDLPGELFSIILEDDCLERADLINVTQVCHKLSEQATRLLFHTLSTTVMKDSSFDMRWHDLQDQDHLRGLVQVVRLEPSSRHSWLRGVSHPPMHQVVTITDNYSIHR
jgi:hypothetical protein